MKCSVCHHLINQDAPMGSCLCLPSHGEWHLACDPHRRPPREELIDRAIRDIIVETNGEYDGERVRSVLEELADDAIKGKIN